MSNNILAFAPVVTELYYALKNYRATDAEYRAGTRPYTDVDKAATYCRGLLKELYPHLALDYEKLNTIKAMIETRFEELRRNGRLDVLREECFIGQNGIYIDYWAKNAGTQRFDNIQGQESVAQCAQLCWNPDGSAYHTPEYKDAVKQLYVVWKDVLTDEQIENLSLAIPLSYDRIDYGNITPVVLSGCHTVGEFADAIYDAPEIGPRERVYEPDDEPEI